MAYILQRFTKKEYELLTQQYHLAQKSPLICRKTALGFLVYSLPFKIKFLYIKMRFGQSILSLRHVKGNGKIPKRFDMPSEEAYGSTDKDWAKNAILRYLEVPYKTSTLLHF